jgi:MFS family permease
MALTVLCTALQPFSIGGATVVPLLAVAAFGQSIAWPNVSSLISRNVSWEHQGQFLGLNNAVGALARVVGPFCAGLIFSNIGIDMPFYAAGLVVLPAIFLAWAAHEPLERTEAEPSAAE